MNKYFNIIGRSSLFILAVQGVTIINEFYFVIFVVLYGLGLLWCLEPLFYKGELTTK